MKTRDLLTAIIRERVRGLPIEEVQLYVDNLPADVEAGATQFCTYYLMGPWLCAKLVQHDVSVAYELYRFIEESKQAVDTSKGVGSPRRTHV